MNLFIIPDLTRTQIVEGKRSSRRRYEEPRPKPYDGGLGMNGVEALDRFVRKGGMLVTLGNAAELAIHDPEAFDKIVELAKKSEAET